ncbi:Uncharacterised protein [Klebsiella quasipneumoniae]|nr:Uncharacterised protein [Klebsiella quasipneumoniae]
MPHLLQNRLVHPPVRRVVALLLLGQQLADPGEKPKRIRRAIKHVGQTQIVRVLVKMPVVIANKADRAAADGIGLAIEDVNARTLLNDDNFMKIMVMLRKGRLREAGFNSHRRDPGLKEIRTVQYGHDATLVMRKIISHRLIVMKGWLSSLQFLTAKIRKSCRFFKNQPERCGTADPITSSSPPPKTAICDFPHGHLCFLASGQFRLSVARRCESAPFFRLRTMILRRIVP